MSNPDGTMEDALARSSDTVSKLIRERQTLLANLRDGISLLQDHHPGGHEYEWYCIDERDCGARHEEMELIDRKVVIAIIDALRENV